MLNLKYSLYFIDIILKGEYLELTSKQTCHNALQNNAQTQKAVNLRY